MQFRKLAIGDAFKFTNDVQTFNRVCVKISKRCYTWRNRDQELRSQVGTINVKVERAND